MKKIKAAILIIFAATISFMMNAQDNSAGKAKLPLDNVKGSTVIFTFGQSNAANHGQTLYSPHNQVMNYYAGELYEAKDPLIGATGNRGCVWTRLADKMIDSGLAEKVTIISIAIGATDIASWSEGGILYDKFIQAIEKMKDDNINPDYILWHQGESDNIANTSADDYMSRFESIRNAFRSRGIDAPIFIAVASYHPDCVSDTCNGNDENIRKAQKDLARKYKDIFLGPDTDKLDKCMYRHDGVHLSSIGLDKHADGWLRALKHPRHR